MGRQCIVRNVPGWRRPRRTPPVQRGIALKPLLDLVYGADVDDDLVRRAAESAGDHVTDLAQLRAVIHGFDRQTHPTAMEIRFGADDVEWVRVRGLVLAVDRADPAISAALADGSWEPHVTRLFERFVRPGMTVVDVGANIGYFSLLAAGLVGPSGRVYSFDPNPENCRLIALTAHRNGLQTIRLFPVALGASNGHTYFTGALGSNGTLVSDDPALLLEGRGSLVPVFRLEDVLTDGPLDLVKVDVEGAEHLAVQGALSLIEASRPIVISEFSCDMIARVSGVEPTAYLRTFTDRDYRVFVIERTGDLVAVDSAERLVDAWPHPVHIEDLLLIPEERAPELTA
jgi:FkbM family methyltransferase